MAALTPSVVPYGEWESPITAKFITEAGVGLGSLSTGLDGSLYWLESRPQEQGRNVVVKAMPGDAAATKVEVTPEKSNVRTRVHEYGGGAFVLAPNNDGVIYSNFKDQRLYWQHTAGELQLVCSSGGGIYRFADGVINPAGTHIICVREDHTKPAPPDVVNELVSIALDGSGTMTVLATGNDFYSAPRVSPDGSKIAYLTWSHPNMPWDSTALMVASATDGSDPVTVAGGLDSNVSVLQPLWQPGTGVLHFLSDETGWYNLYSWSEAAADTTAPIYPMEAEFSGSSPGWRLGQQAFTFLSDSSLVATYACPESGTSVLLVFPPPASSETAPRLFKGVGHGLPRSFSDVTPSAHGATLYFMGGSPEDSPGIYSWAIPAAGSPVIAATMVVRSMSDDVSVDPAFISTPQHIAFPTTFNGSDTTAHGYYYPPANPNCEGPEGAAPPLLVKAHGGPTSQTSSNFRLDVQFWTSRGVAVLDVDYGGSCGYGREYRNRLVGNWGVVDVEDVCAGATYCVAQGYADGARLAIDGGSAGGYTTLGALTWRSVFTAGCSKYGIGDLGALAEDTHKFESRYMENLLGGVWPQDKARYDERAPVNAVEQLDCPILLLQGDEDKVVPPNQSEQFYNAAKGKGIPTCLKMYEGEQHGFRKAENIEDSLNSELTFFGKVFGFTPAGDLPELSIDNADQLP